MYNNYNNEEEIKKLVQSSVDKFYKHLISYLITYNRQNNVMLAQL